MDAAETFILPQELVFVDLETTGGNAACHRITEIGIVRMLEGEVVEEWSSLVNPDCRIPAYIESFTGITNEMVAGAPRFRDIAPVVLDKLRAPVFAAHNARFDYGFLRTEFRRLDMRFSAQVLCTVKLSRRLFPEFPRHSLDAVMERHQLTCAARHRALGDARVIGEFWSKLRGEIPEHRLAAAAQSVIGANKLPAHLPQELADELPEGPGVYRFFGDDGVLLYVGKSHSLRRHVLGHFAAGHSDTEAHQRAQQTRRIDWIETAGDLGAQLKELECIRAQRPLFGKRSRESAGSFTWRIQEAAAGVELAALADLNSTQIDRCFGVFHARRDACKALTDIARAHSLCLKILGLEQSAGSCVGYQMGRCRGVCVGHESVPLHGARLQMALSGLKLKRWPFPGRVALKEGAYEYHVLDRWAYLGTARTDDELAELRSKAAPAAFDVDVYRILVRYLAKNRTIDWHHLREPCAS